MLFGKTSSTLLDKRYSCPCSGLDMLWAPRGWGSHDFQTIGPRTWKGCQPWAPVTSTPQGRPLVLIYVTAWVEPRATVRSERLTQRKILNSPLGTEPNTFWLVRQCLDPLRYCVPPIVVGTSQNLCVTHHGCKREPGGNLATYMTSVSPKLQSRFLGKRLASCVVLHTEHYTKNFFVIRSSTSNREDASRLEGNHLECTLYE